MAESFHDVPLGEAMVKNAITVQIGADMSEAYEKMHDYHIRHLPVLDEKHRVAGIFTYTDLLRAYHPRETQSGWLFDRDEMNLHILEHFMTRDPVTLTTEDTLKHAIEIMARSKYGCIPIVSPKTGELEGIVSQIDVLKHIARYC